MRYSYGQEILDIGVTFDTSTACNTETLHEATPRCGDCTFSRIPCCHFSCERRARMVQGTNRWHQVGG